MKQWSNWNALGKMTQKSTKSYREYAYHWRKKAAEVRPPMAEQEISESFLCIQEPEYFDMILSCMGAKFGKVVKVGEAIKYSLKTGKIALIPTQTKPSSLLRRKRKDVSSISYKPRSKHVKFDSRKHSLSNTYLQAPQIPYRVFSIQLNF